MSFSLKDLIQPIFKYKGYLGLVLLSALVFFALRFPYGDLSDLISSQVAEASNNMIFLQFKEAGPTLTPRPGFQLREVRLSSQVMPTIESSTLTLAPSWLSLLRGAPGATISAQGLLGSNLSLTWQSRRRTAQGNPAHRVELQSPQLDLTQLTRHFNSPLTLRGLGQLELDALIEPQFEEQPEVELELDLASLQMESSRIPTPMGPMDVSGLSWDGGLRLRGRLVGGELIIEEGQLGQASDSLSLQVRGRLGLRLAKQRVPPRGETLVPEWGNYDLRFQILAGENLPQDWNLILSALGSNLRRQTPDGERYLFRMTGPRFGPPPQITPIDSL